MLIEPLVFILLNGFLEGRGGQSMGKRLACLYLIQPGSGEYIGGWRGVYRRVLHVLDTIPMCLGWLYGLGTGRTVADTIAGTIVVRRP